MLSRRENVQTSKFWWKSKETKRKFLKKIYQGHIRIWFRPKKKLFHACVPLRAGYTPAGEGWMLEQKKIKQQQK
jgi:hypothetical protein